jgi:hypothetical protein
MIFFDSKLCNLCNYCAIKIDLKMNFSCFKIVQFVQLLCN